MEFNSTETSKLSNVSEYNGLYCPSKSEHGKAIHRWQIVESDIVWAEDKPSYDTIIQYADSLHDIIVTKGSIKAYKLCGCPIFKKTYWGQFVFDYPANDPEVYHLAHNRDAMVYRFGITDVVKQTIALSGPMYDHAEVYRLKSGAILLVVSPYGEEYHSELISNWFIDLGHKIYSKNAHTFYRTFADLKAFNQFCKDPSK